MNTCYNKLIYFAVFAVFFFSCTERFDEINTDPNRATKEKIDQNLLLPSALVKYASVMGGYGGGLLFQSMWVQTFASTSGGQATYHSNGDRYQTTGGTPGYTKTLWDFVYLAASQAYEMEQIATERKEVNSIAVANIIKVLCFSTLTDTYGDIPYSQALQARQGITLPKYDRQEDIYKQMLVELDTATKTLDASKGSIPFDPLYQGDIKKWKKFGNSLLLKLAMRLVKVDTTLAKVYADRAIKGGVFSSTEDGAILNMDNSAGYGNSRSAALVVEGDILELRWSKTFIDFMQANNDIRLPFISEVPPNGFLANQDPASGGDNSSANQIGLPNGYTEDNIAKAPNYPGISPKTTKKDDKDFVIGKYSRPTTIYRDRSGPVFILTYPEVQFLLAEAAVKGGYGTTATSESYYKEGLKGALESLKYFGDKSAIKESDITTYANSHPLDVSSQEKSLEMINTQYWATTGIFSNYLEAWNNWKRTDYPRLTPVKASGDMTDGQIPRRQMYPQDEAVKNPKGYRDAVEMGGDHWVGRVWWDK